MGKESGWGWMPLAGLVGVLPLAMSAGVPVFWILSVLAWWMTRQALAGRLLADKPWQRMLPWGLALLGVASLLPAGASPLPASLLLGGAGLCLLGPRLAQALDSGFALIVLILRLALLPGLLCMLPFIWFEARDGAVLPSALLLPWLQGALALLLMVAAARQTRPAPRAWLELALIVAVQCLLWGAWHTELHAQQMLPLELLYLPLYLWAAARFGMAGPLVLGALGGLLAHLGGAVPPGIEQQLYCEAVNMLSAGASLALAIAIEGQRSKDKALRDSYARFEALIDQSPNVMAIKGMDGRYLLANKACAQLLGVPQSSVIGFRPADFLPPVLAGKLDAMGGQVLACLEARQQEEVLQIGNEPHTFLATLFPLFDSAGHPSGIGTIASDITPIKHEERQRAEMMEKYRAVVEQSLVGIFIQQNGMIVYLNPTLAELGGYQVDDLLGQPLTMVLMADEVERINQQIRLRQEKKLEVTRFSCRLRHRDGSAVDVEIHSRLIDYQGQQAFIGVCINVSDRVTAQTELRLAAKVFENSAEGIMITDALGRIVTVNAAFTRITGYRYEEATGRVSRMFRNVDGSGNLLEELSRSGHWDGEMYDRRKNEEWYPAELTISAVRDVNGDIANYVGVFSDITGRKQAEERLHFLANHDPLTSLPNRSHLIGHLDNALGGGADDGFQLALMFIDLDRFKLINDSFGHQAGDGMLCEIATRLTRVSGRYGMVARLGGDEFTLVVEDYQDHEQLCRIADEVLAELAGPLFLEGQELFVTGSIGISLYPHDGTDARTLLKNADVAMYRAKERGKNTWQFFDAAMNTQSVERLLLENALRQALEKNEFELHYQPQVDARSLQVVGVETLIRWRHPQLGLVSPVRFIPLAEESGLIKPIGAWVLREACRQLAQWDQEGLAVPRVAVNLSARQFEQQDLAIEVDRALEGAGIDAERLELEITESMLMQKPEEAVLILNQLKALGVTLSLDDFGTGYSSLSMLTRFPLDCLKIDRSFVEGLPGDDNSAAITQAIIAMARKLRYTVIAEGVETAAQGTFLAENSCHILQGYYYSRPLPASELPAFFSRHAVAVRVRSGVECAVF
ncbi:sensor domain-containing protein [Craterilacuibacter sp.]|uniref:sensor domain-containing protein n=1 Tax=Craterilacuibacter sp. TaxID=2870909 RepID=UPI003F2B0E06